MTDRRAMDGWKQVPWCRVLFLFSILQIRFVPAGINRVGEEKKKKKKEKGGGGRKSERVLPKKRQGFTSGLYLDVVFLFPRFRGSFTKVYHIYNLCIILYVFVLQRWLWWWWWWLALPQKSGTLFSLYYIYQVKIRTSNIN